MDRRVPSRGPGHVGDDVKLSKVRTRVTADEAQRIMLAVYARPLAPYVNASAPWSCECIVCGSRITPSLKSVVYGKPPCESCVSARLAQATQHNYSDDHEAAAAVNIDWIDPGRYSHCRKAECWECGFVFFTSTWMVVRQHRGCFKCEDRAFSTRKRSVVQLLNLPGRNIGRIATMNIGSTMPTLHEVRGWQVHSSHEVETGKTALDIESRVLVWLAESSNALVDNWDEVPRHSDFREAFRTEHQSLATVNTYVGRLVHSPEPNMTASCTLPTRMAPGYLRGVEARAGDGDLAAIRELAQIAARLDRQDEARQLLELARSTAREHISEAASDGDVTAMVSTARFLLSEWKREAWKRPQSSESQDGAGDLDQALVWAARAASQGSIGGHLACAEVMLAMEDLDAARTWCEAAIDLGQSAEVKLAAGEIAHWQMREAGLAKEWLLAALSQAARENARRVQARAEYQLGWLARKQGDLEQARHWWTAARASGHRGARVKLEQLERWAERSTDSGPKAD